MIRCLNFVTTLVSVGLFCACADVDYLDKGDFVYINETK